MKYRVKIKSIIHLTALGIATGGVFAGLSGCSGPVDDVPLTKEGRIKAIEDNPNYKPEQKAAFKQQIEESERLKAMAEAEGRKFKTDNKATPMPSR